MISKLKILPILATLGTGELFTGIGIVLTNGSAISDFSKKYAAAINNRIAGIHVQFIIFIIVAAVLGFMMKKTTYGKKLTLMGTSQNVAKFSGLKADGCGSLDEQISVGRTLRTQRQGIPQGRGRLRAPFHRVL